jgi:hypothetical protein
MHGKQRGKWPQDRRVATDCIDLRQALACEPLRANDGDGARDSTRLRRNLSCPEVTASAGFFHAFETNQLPTRPNSGAIFVARSRRSAGLQVVTSPTSWARSGPHSAVR